MKIATRNRRQRSGVAFKVFRGVRIITLHTPSTARLVKALRRYSRPVHAVAFGSTKDGMVTQAAYTALRLSDAEAAAVREAATRGHLAATSLPPSVESL